MSEQLPDRAESEAEINAWLDGHRCPIGCVHCIFVREHARTAIQNERAERAIGTSMGPDDVSPAANRAEIEARLQSRAIERLIYGCPGADDGVCRSPWGNSTDDEGPLPASTLSD